MLDLKSLSVAYGSRPILDKISFSLPAGQVLGLIGPNGAGKTTLIRAISGVIPLSSGQVWVNGAPLDELPPRQRAHLLAVVPQARSLPPAFTAWETVALGRTPHLGWLGQLSARDDALIREAMQRTDTLALADRPVGELSGGEQQRLLVARALAQAAPILLMDEPTAHLDLQYQLGLLELVKDLAHRDGLAVLMALHDLNLVARYTDQVALLVDGRIEAQGNPSQVLTPHRLSRAYRVPLQVIAAEGSSVPLILPK